MSCGGIQRGAGAPLCVVVGVGFIGEGPHRKGPAPMRFFGYFLSVQKVTKGTGAEPPKSFGEEICFFPTRPAMGESEPIGANCWHRVIRPGVRGRRSRSCRKENGI